MSEYQDKRSGLWLPSSVPPPVYPPFPPVLDLPADHKVPRRIENVEKYPNQPSKYSWNGVPYPLA